MKSTQAISAGSPLIGPRQLIIAAIAVVIAVIAMPFGTAVLSLPARMLFWGLLIGLNQVKWSLWYRYGLRRAGEGWQGMALMVVAGAILLNLTLPFEVELGFRLVGYPVAIDWAPNFAAAMLISLGVGTGIALAQGDQPPVVAEAPPVPAPSTGLALRAGLADLRLLESIIAEDHYLRLHLADGRAPLVLYRFGDGLRELAAIDGEQVHRSAWVAAAAVRGAVREGRRWRLCLAGGSTVPVSETFLPAVRARGWLKRQRG